MVQIGNHMFYCGQLVSCYIEGEYVEGHLYIGDDRLWICHDDPSHDGDDAPDRYGHKYSWTFRVINGRFTDQVSNLVAFNSKINFKKFEFSNELNSDLIKFLPSRTITQLFYSVVKPFEIYSSASYSEKTGYILLRGSSTRPDGSACQKKLEIKFSRFCKRVSDAFKDLTEEAIFESDHAIETAYNNFVAIREGSFYKLQILSGEDISYGYKQENYANLVNGTLHKSCMTDKLSFLSIYTQNPNQVQLAVLSSTNGVEARCLIWTASDGTKLFDRIYYTQDWCEKVLFEKLEKLSYLCIDKHLESKCSLDVVLDKYEFEEYPYMDNFKFRMKGSNRLHAVSGTSRLEAGSYQVYVSTRGDYQNANY